MGTYLDLKFVLQIWLLSTAAVNYLGFVIKL